MNETKGVKVVVARARVPLGRRDLAIRYQSVCERCVEKQRRFWPTGKQFAKRESAEADARRHSLLKGCAVVG